MIALEFRQESSGVRHTAHEKMHYPVAAEAEGVFLNFRKTSSQVRQRSIAGRAHDVLWPRVDVPAQTGVSKRFPGVVIGQAMATGHAVLAVTA